MSLSNTRNQIVLISGVNGYIASVTAKAFLEAGYSVRGTSRSKASSEGLLKALHEYVDAGRLEIVEVKDITIDGAFDAAVKGKSTSHPTSKNRINTPRRPCNRSYGITGLFPFHRPRPNNQSRPSRHQIHSLLSTQARLSHPPTHRLNLLHCCCTIHQRTTLHLH